MSDDSTEAVPIQFDIQRSYSFNFNGGLRQTPYRAIVCFKLPAREASTCQAVSVIFEN